jgi:hypothetical protein
VVLSPLGLVTAALIAGGVAWARWTDSGRAAMSAISEVAGRVFATLKETWGGVVDALMAGDLALAGTIAMKGLQLAVTQVLAEISVYFGDTFGSIVGDLLAGDFSSAFSTVLSGLSLLWQSWTAGLVSVFTGAARGIIDVWEQAAATISTAIIDLANDYSVLSKIVLGVDLGAEVSRGRALNDQLRSRGLGSGNTDPLEEAKRAAIGGIGADANSMRGVLDQMDSDAQARLRDAAEAFSGRTQGGTQGLSDNVKRLQEELAALSAGARAAREAAKGNAGAAGGAGGAGAGIAAPDIAEMRKQASAVTFSGAALQALGSAGPQEKLLAVARNQEKLQEKQLAKMDKQIRVMERFQLQTVG